MLNSRKSLFLVLNEKQGESNFSLSTVNQNTQTVSWLSKIFVGRIIVFKFGKPAEFSLSGISGQFWHFFPGKCCTEV